MNDVVYEKVMEHAGRNQVGGVADGPAGHVPPAPAPPPSNDTPFPLLPSNPYACRPNGRPRSRPICRAPPMF